MSLIKASILKPKFKRNAYLAKGLYLFIFAVGHVMAAEFTITARYLPDSNNPTVNNFENTTPNTGYCASYPGWCLAGRRFSIAIPNTTDYMQLIKDQRVSLSVPYPWRNVQITHSDGSTQTVKLRIVGISARYQLSPSAIVITGVDDYHMAHLLTWREQGWSVPPIGCLANGSTINEFAYSFLWMFNSASPCTKFSSYDVTPGLLFNDISLIYEIETPNPLDMSMGTYSGRLTYTVGQYGDVVFGTTRATDPFVNLNFTLSVQHNLRVQFPASENHLELAPQGGWQQWKYNDVNHTPEKLTASQPYQQWSSTRFKMQLQCQYPAGADCGIQNDTGSQTVAVKTSVTLPNGLLNTSNQPVNHYPLTNNTASVFKPTRYVNDEAATLYFEVDKSGVEKMLGSGDERFRGDVTVIWDSQV